MFGDMLAELLALLDKPSVLLIVLTIGGVIGIMLESTLDKIVITRNPQWQVMAQVSLGEFLASEDAEAYRCINSKRVDFALMDESCRVRHALEYQGSGQHRGSAAARDPIKKEALRKAGIGYHEIVAGHTTPAELKRLIEKLVPVGSRSARTSLGYEARGKGRAGGDARVTRLPSGSRTCARVE